MESAPEFTQVIFDAQATALMLFGDDLRLLTVNPAGEALLATSARNVLGAEPRALFPEAIDWISMVERGYRSRRALREHGVVVQRPARDSLLVDCIVTPFSNDAGRFLLVEMVQVNRQQHIHNGEQVLLQHETVHALMRGLAHEIRNPLGGLRGAAQLLERELGDPTLEEYTRVIIGEADRLQKLLDRLLGPRTVPKTRPVNIHEVTERLCKLVRAESPAGVALVCDYDPSIPEFDADPDLLIQALLNVVRNAAQAVGEQGTITLRTRAERQVTLGGQRHRLALRLDIVDDGPGIAPDMLDKIFYPMVTGRPDGTGLGLSIAQNLIHQHGGLIQCSSRPGKTVMTTWLPLERS